MIIVQLQGGLGNQMFQYAAGRSLASRLKTKLMLDLSWYDRASQDDGVNARVYELGPMKIQENIFQPSLINRVRLKLAGSQVFGDEDNPYLFHPDFLKLPDNTRLFGYFQNPKYFQSIRDELVQEFSLRTPATGQNQKLLQQIEADRNSVSLHVRRGDYVTSAAHAAHHGAKGLDYYQKALQMIQKTVEQPNLYVFSDDPAWCQANLKLAAPMIHVSGNDYGGEDMRLMRACRHNIIANSSFSWWGAWLNQNPTKIVVAPKEWLKNATYDTRDLLPPEWEKL